MLTPTHSYFLGHSQKARIQIWLYENNNMRIEGRVVGFDEYTNLVLDDACEVCTKKQTRTKLGRILIKGDNITLMQNAPDDE